MAKTDNTTPARLPSRWRALLGGILIGFVWGSFMWLVLARDRGAEVWLYLAISTAMIGGGIGAVFGASSARKRGERISPRFRRKDR